MRHVASLATLCLAWSIACGARAPVPAPRPTPREAAHDTPRRRVSARVPSRTGSAPTETTIDVHAEPWRSPNDPAPGAERTPDPGDKISVLDVWPTRFQRSPPRGFGFAHALMSRVRFEVRSKRWREELRTRCRDPGTLSSRALVTDQEGRIRALTEESGTEDSAYTTCFVYDEQERIRLFFLSYRHYSGTVTEELAAFDTKGTPTVCNYLVLKKGDWMPNSCARPEDDDDEDDETKLDPEVRRALRPQAQKPKQRVVSELEEFAARSPREEFERCLPGAVPRQD